MKIKKIALSTLVAMHIGINVLEEGTKSYKRKHVDGSVVSEEEIGRTLQIS